MKKWLAILLVCVTLLAAATCATAETGATEELPVKWDLDSIYASVEEWQADYDEVMGMLDRYEEFRGTLNNAQSIYDFLQFAYYTELTEKQMKLEMYAELGNALNSTDPVFTELNAKLDAMDVKESQLGAFATPEIYALPLEEREKIFADPLFEGYEYSVRAFTDPDKQPLGEEAQMALATVSMGQGYAYDIFSNLEYVEIDGAVCRGTLDQSIHDEEQRSSQVGRTLLGGAVAFPVVVARLVRAGVNAGEGGQRLPVREPCGVADLGHKLRTQGRTDAIHGHDDGVFRKGGGDLIHLDTKGFHHL